MLGIIVRESKAEDSSGMAILSQQSHPGAARQGLDEQKEPQPGRGAGSSAHISPWIRVVPRAPQDLPRIPRGDDQPRLVRHSHPHSQQTNSHTPGCLCRCSQGGFADQPWTTMQSRSSPGLVAAATRQGEAAPSPVPAKSWALRRCALGKCPAAPLAEVPFLHPLHLLGTPTSILGKKTVTSITHFLQFLGMW